MPRLSGTRAVAPRAHTAHRTCRQALPAGPIEMRASGTRHIPHDAAAERNTCAAWLAHRTCRHAVFAAPRVCLWDSWALQFTAGTGGCGHCCYTAHIRGKPLAKGERAGAGRVIVGLVGRLPPTPKGKEESVPAALAPPSAHHPRYPQTLRGPYAPQGGSVGVCVCWEGWGWGQRGREGQTLAGAEQKWTSEAPTDRWKQRACKILLDGTRSGLVEMQKAVSHG